MSGYSADRHSLRHEPALPPPLRPRPRPRRTFESGPGAILIIDALAVMLIVATSLAAYVWIDSSRPAAAAPQPGATQPPIAVTSASPAASGPIANSSATPAGPSLAPTASALPQPTLVYGKGTWATLDPLAQARWAAASVVLRDGRIMVIGGATGESSYNATTSVVLFDPKSNSWSQATDMLQPRAYPMATLLADGSVLVVGGSRNGQPLDTTERYNVDNGTWVATARLNLPRTQGTLTLLADGKVLAAGGGIEGNPGWHSTASTEIYDPNADEWTIGPPMAVARAVHTATRLQDGTVLVVGGATTYHGSTGTVTNRAEIYDPRTGTWHQAASMAKPLYVHGAALMKDGRVLVAGGWWATSNSDPSHGNVQIYDPAANKWTATGALVTPRAQFNLVALPDGRCLAIGGVDPAYHTLASSELYDPATGAWQTSGNMAVAMMWPAIGALPDGRVFVAGGALDALAKHVTAVSEMYTPAKKQANP